MSSLLAVLVLSMAVLLLWRLLASLFQSGQPAEPVDAEPIDDPRAFVPALRKNSPRGRSGAVAVEEPTDDDSLADCFPPRILKQ